MKLSDIMNSLEPGQSTTIKITKNYKSQYDSFGAEIKSIQDIYLTFCCKDSSGIESFLKIEGNKMIKNRKTNTN